MEIRVYFDEYGNKPFTECANSFKSLKKTYNDVKFVYTLREFDLVKYDLKEKNAAILIEEKNLKSDILVNAIDNIMNDEEKREEMKKGRLLYLLFYFRYHRKLSSMSKI